MNLHHLIAPVYHAAVWRGMRAFDPGAAIFIAACIAAVAMAAAYYFKRAR